MDDDSSTTRRTVLTTAGASLAAAVALAGCGSPEGEDGTPAESPAEGEEDVDVTPGINATDEDESPGENGGGATVEDTPGGVGGNDTDQDLTRSTPGNATGGGTGAGETPVLTPEEDEAT